MKTFERKFRIIIHFLGEGGYIVPSVGTVDKEKQECVNMVTNISQAVFLKLTVRNILILVTNY